MKMVNLKLKSLKKLICFVFGHRFIEDASSHQEKVFFACHRCGMRNGEVETLRILPPSDEKVERMKKENKNKEKR